jgi:hypothetical protein
LMMPRKLIVFFQMAFRSGLQNWSKLAGSLTTVTGLS